jgi:hypothetical protein
MVDLPATNNPLTPAQKRAFAQIYQSHPLLKRLLDNAATKKIGEYVFAWGII